MTSISRQLPLDITFYKPLLGIYPLDNYLLDKFTKPLPARKLLRDIYLMGNCPRTSISRQLPLDVTFYKLLLDIYPLDLLYKYHKPPRQLSLDIYPNTASPGHLLLRQVSPDIYLISIYPGHIPPCNDPWTFTLRQVPPNIIIDSYPQTSTPRWNYLSDNYPWTSPSRHLPLARYP